MTSFWRCYDMNARYQWRPSRAGPHCKDQRALRLKHSNIPSHSLVDFAEVCFSRGLLTCSCVPQHPAHEAGRPAGPLPGRLQPHGHVQGPRQEERVTPDAGAACHATSAPFNPFKSVHSVEYLQCVYICIYNCVMP